MLQQVGGARLRWVLVMVMAPSKQSDMLYFICTVSHVSIFDHHTSTLTRTCHSSHRHRNVSTGGPNPAATLCMLHGPLVLTCVATTIISRRGSSHYRGSSRWHLAEHLDLIRHPVHPSTTGGEPVTMGVHSNALPVTHIPTVRTQAMPTTINGDSGLPYSVAANT